MRSHSLQFSGSPTLPITVERGNEWLAFSYPDSRDYGEGNLRDRNWQEFLENLISVSKSRMLGGGFLGTQPPSVPWEMLIASPPVLKPWLQESGVIDSAHRERRLEQLRQDEFATVDQLARYSNSLRLVTEGQEPLATSHYGANVQRWILGISQASLERLRVVATPPPLATPSLGDTIVTASMFPTQVAISDFSELEVTEQTLAGEREQTRLANKLHAVFEAEVLQDGEHHPAEDLVQEALRHPQKQLVLKWFQAWAVDASQPSFAASLLRCLGRQERLGTDPWRTELIREALSVGNVEIRDAAVQAVESWEDQELIQVLMGHDEPEHWLKDYIQGVICDLTH